jgi:hypothetical protein
MEGVEAPEESRNAALRDAKGCYPRVALRFTRGYFQVFLAGRKRSIIENGCGCFTGRPRLLRLTPNP